MLMGVERLVDLAGLKVAGLEGVSPNGVREAVQHADIDALAASDGHFAALARDGQTVRMARTIGIPLRYFVAKMFHGPFLIASDRIDSLFAWCQAQKIGWQFDPMYTRMVPAHYLVEIDQIGCPDPAPRYHRFFTPPIAQGTPDKDAAGAAYVGAAYNALQNWLRGLADGEPIALAFSGGIDSTSVLLLARHALQSLGRNPNLLRAFTLDMGGGKDAAQAEQVVKSLGLEAQWEAVCVDAGRLDLESAIGVIEDYHPLDVECAAVALLLLQAIRERYPTLKYLLDGDGGDENLKSYPLEDSDLTLSSVLRNPMLYQEGWGVENMKHSLTYSGGLSRAYVRTYAPGQRYGFEAFSPYTVRSVIAQALAIPFEQVLNGSVERLYTLKQEVVRAGVQSVTGIDMPVYPKRRFQDGAGGEGAYRNWRVSKAWCRQVFLRQWEDRLREAWDGTGERLSGNVVPASIPIVR
jgi:asparagine synthase (glutamine-hydrolysing)